MDTPVIKALTRKTNCFLAGLLLAGFSVWGRGLDWPARQLLPTFSKPAATIDCIDISQASGPEQDVFASLEGIVNRTQPRIACLGHRSPQDQLDWLQLHHLAYERVDGYRVAAKYKKEITGLVVTDPAVPDTLNLATALAGLNNELICAPELLPALTNAPCNFPIKDDLRGRFATSKQIYEYIRTNCWPRCTHRVVAGLSGRTHGCLRDYLVAVKSAVVWFDPASNADAAALIPFFSAMKPAGSVYLGWWPDEGAGLKFAGQHGIPVLASDFFENGSLFSGVVQPIVAPPVAPPPPLENKIYLAMILSDGDNVQYMQHHMRHAWANPARGSVPIGWTVSPLCADLDPAMLNYYYSTASTNDCLVSGPSGAGYARLNFWSKDNLSAFTKKSDRYLRRSGIRVITVWNRVTDAVADSFAAHCPALLGVTDQDGVNYAAVHGGLPVMGFASGSNYADNILKIDASISIAAAKWNGTAPVFIVVQADSWFIGPADLQTVAAVLDKDKFVIVRPDHLFMLLKQSLVSRR
jgi:hypothetical protein